MGNARLLRYVISHMERRYDDDQVADILRRAAELQSASGATRESGVTLSELRRVGSEVGFDPGLIEQAARELESSSMELQTESARGITSLEQTVLGDLDDEAWEDIIAELRRATGRAGKSSTRKLVREWVNGGEATNITFSATRRGDGTRLRMLLNLSGGRILGVMASIPLGLLSVVLPGALLHKAGVSTPYAMLTGLGVASTLLVGIQLVVRNWMRSSRRLMAESFRKVVERASLAPEPAQVEHRTLEVAPAVEISLDAQ